MEIPKNLVLALRDVLIVEEALWLPFRFTSSEDWHLPAVAIVERRRRWRAAGLPFVVGGEDAARQSGARILAQLRRAGLLEVCGRGRHRGVRLTLLGDWAARTMFCARTLPEAWPWLVAIERARVEISDGTNAGFVNEWDVIEVGPRDERDLSGHDLCVDLDDAAGVLQRHDLAEAMTDTCGSVGYRVSDAGRAALEAGEPKPPDDLPAYRSDMADEFVELLTAEWRGRQNWRSEDGREVFVPLSAGMWPDRRPKTRRAKPRRKPANAS